MREVEAPFTITDAGVFIQVSEHELKEMHISAWFFQITGSHSTSR
jgi:hypothetical protein